MAVNDIEMVIQIETDKIQSELKYGFSAVVARRYSFSIQHISSNFLRKFEKFMFSTSYLMAMCFADRIIAFFINMFRKPTFATIFTRKNGDDTHNQKESCLK